MVTWGELSVRFRKLGEVIGSSKSSSWSMSVYFSPTVKILVELGGYDVSGWNRHHSLGEFDNEQDALVATVKAIEEAEKIVKEEVKNDQEIL